MPLYKSKLKGQGDTITVWQKMFRALNPIRCGHASLLGPSSGISTQCCYAGCKRAVSALTPIYNKLNSCVYWDKQQHSQTVYFLCLFHRLCGIAKL